MYNPLYYSSTKKYCMNTVESSYFLQENLRYIFKLLNAVYIQFLGLTYSYLIMYIYIHILFFLHQCFGSLDVGMCCRMESEGKDPLPSTITNLDKTNAYYCCLMYVCIIKTKYIYKSRW